MRQFWVCAVLLVLLASLPIGTVSGAVTETFQNGNSIVYQSSSLPHNYPVLPTSMLLTPSAWPYLDTFCIVSSPGTGAMCNGIPIPVNYMSYHQIATNTVNQYIPLSHGVGTVNGSWGYGWPQPASLTITGSSDIPYPLHRVEIIRVDNTARVYVDGVHIATPSSAVFDPRYISTSVTKVGLVRYGYSDDDTVDGPPVSWCVSKDIADPYSCGLYNNENMLVYNTQMHAKYSIFGDTAGATISIDGDHQVQQLGGKESSFTYGGTQYSGVISAGIVNFNLTQFMAEKPYGRHVIRLTTSAGTTDSEFWYTGAATVDTAIVFDRGIYVPQDSIGITTSISNDHYIPGQYSYKACIYDRTTGDYKENWSVTTQTSAHSTAVSTSLFPVSGEYMALLYAIDSTGQEILLDTDICQVYTDKVVFSGTVFDAKQGTVMSGATVSLTQSGTTSTQTTGSDGRFEFLNLNKDVLTSLSATKSGFIKAWSNTTPAEYKRYEVQIALAPSAPAHSGEAVFGTVRSYPLGSFVASPTVRILKDGSLVNSTTATEKGFYIFDGLDASTTYTVEVSKTGFVNYSNAVITGTGSSLTQMDPWLLPLLNLTVNLKDAVSLQPITSLMAVSIAGQSQQTSTGSTTFSNIQLGAVTIAVVGSGYQANQTSLTLTEDDEVTLYITPLAVVPTTNVPLTPTPTPALVSMTGKVYDGMSGQPITSTAVNVSAVQGAVTRSDSTDSSGSYSIPNIQNGALITVNATASGYTHTAFSFTPAGAATYVVDLYMYRTDESTNPTITPSAGRAGAGGTVLGGPYHELIESPTVAASNGSWTGTATMTADHVWYFSDLEPSSGYNFTASAGGYITQSVQATMGAAGSFTVVPIILNGVYDVTITVKDSTSYALILQPVQLTLSNGQVGNTSTGSYTFTNLEYATYVVSAASDGYTGGGISFLAYGDHTEYLYLSKTPSGPSSSIEYAIPPKHVDLIARNIFGAPLSGVNVTVQGQSTTLPDPSILDAIFGWVDDYSDVDMANVTMTGVTGSDGGVSFMMTDAVRYLVTFTDPTRGISETVELMPHDTQYMFILGSMSATPSAGMPNMTLWVDGEEGASPALRGYYSDPAGTTSALYFIVESINGTTRTEVGNQSLGAVQTASPSYTVNHTTGAMYSWGFRATTPDRGVLQQWNGITLHSRLVTLPIEESAYFWISMILVFVFAGLFSGNNIKYGFVAFPMFCGVLWYIGWLDVAGITLGIVMVLGVLMYLAKVQVA